MATEELHAWILEAFGTGEFNLSNFRATFLSSWAAVLVAKMKNERNKRARQRFDMIKTE